VATDGDRSGWPRGAARLRSLARTGLWLALPWLAGACIATGDSPWNGGHASIGAGYFEATVDGRIDTISSGLTTEFDFEENGGQDDSDAAIYAAAQAGLAPLEFRLSAFQYENSGTGSFSGEFLDTVFASGTVESDFSVGAYQALLVFDVVNIERIRIGALAGASAIDMDLTVTDATDPSIEESADETVPVPLVGARIDLHVIGGLRIGATGAFFPLDEIDDFEVNCYDFEGGIHFELLPKFEIFGLYRAISIEAEGEIDDVEAAVDMELQGPMLGVALTF
jgi:hypothetical protein